MASLRWWNSEHGTVVGHSPLDHQASFECCSFYLSATRVQMCAIWISIAFSYHKIIALCRDRLLRLARGCEGNSHHLNAVTLLEARRDGAQWPRSAGGKMSMAPWPGTAHWGLQREVGAAPPLTSIGHLPPQCRDAPGSPQRQRPNGLAPRLEK